MDECLGDGSEHAHTAKPLRVNILNYLASWASEIIIQPVPNQPVPTFFSYVELEIKAETYEMK